MDLKPLDGTGSTTTIRGLGRGGDPRDEEFI